MIYKFRILSDENPKFLMDIEIRADQTFYELHDAIQYEAEYDNSQLASFYVVNDHWEKLKEVTLLDMSQGTNPDILVMDEVKLSDVLKKPKQKLKYVFDFFSERSLFLEITEVNKSSSHKSLPVCVNLKGDFPPQIRIGGKNKKDPFAGSFDFSHEEEQTDDRRLAYHPDDEESPTEDSGFSVKNDEEDNDTDTLFKDDGSDEDMHGEFSGKAGFDDEE